jgi:hypothetical protein
MLDPSTAIASAKKVDEALGLIGKVVAKLKRNPDAAAVKLAQALDEIAKTYQVLDTAISSYLSLAIDEGALQSKSKVLLDIEGGALSTDVERGRGHCHIIGNIYFQHLDRWFARALKSDEYEQIRNVFYELGNADDDVFAHMVAVAQGLEKEAEAVLESLIEGDLSAARQRVLSARSELKPLRLSISSTMRRLYELKTEFVGLSGVA